MSTPKQYRLTIQFHAVADSPDDAIRVAALAALCCPPELEFLTEELDQMTRDRFGPCEVTAVEIGATAARRIGDER